MSCSLWFKAWKTMILILIALNLVHVSADMPPTYKYDLKVYRLVEGADCLKQITPIHNLTIDTTFTPEQEKQVLLNIYHNTNGQNWYNQTGWNTSNETSHCNWYGISCHSNTTYVRSIALYSNNLNGFLPKAIWKLRNLLSLCIPDSPDLHGRMEDILFANMSKLQILHFMGTALSGRIPEAVGNFSFVERFLACGMSGDGLSGHLPENIGNMKEMNLLCLGGNNFDGQIPRRISNLKKLGYLDLRNSAGKNKMSGFIQDLFSFKALEHLYVSGIKLQGYMPGSFPPKITNLVLPGNEIHGNLPTTYPANLTYINVANNRLTGDIPASLFFLPQIEGIDVSQNSFSSINNGAEWPNNKSYAKYVSVAGNRNLTVEFKSFTNIFSASIIGGSMGLMALNASFCDMNSYFPTGLQYINSLVTCDLRSNQLHGRIPDIHSDAWYISYLDISFNRFTCDLPQGIENLISLQYLDISGNFEMEEGHNAPINFIAADFSRMTRFGENFACPQARLTFNNGRVRLDPAFYQYKYCLCDWGSYGDNGFCRKCMEGGTCHRPVVTSTTDLEPSIMKLHAGYWPSPSADNVTHLVQCPVRKACNPHGNCICRLQTLRNLTATSSNRSVSLITTCNTSCICHRGNTGRFCSRCKKGFYETGGLCFLCPKPKDNLGFYVFIPVFAVNILVMLWAFLYFKKAPKTAFIIVAVQFLLIFVLTLLDMIPAWVFKLDVVIFVLCMTNRGKVPQTSLIKIGVFYIQTLDSMVSTIEVWPKQVYAAQHYISSFWNLQFSSLSCEFSVLFSPVGKFAFVLLLPIICVHLIGFYSVISFVYHKYKNQEDRIKTTRFKCRQLTMSCLNFTYFPIVEATLSVLRPCGNDAGIRFMPKTPWIECTSRTYHVLSILGWASVIVYVIGFPFILSIFMAVYFRKRSSMSTEERQDMDSWLGSVYLPYKPKYQLYFELILVVRRLFLAFALSFLASFGSVQTMVIWFILTVSSVVQFRFQPYETYKSRCSFENAFESITLFVLSMSFMVLRFAALGSYFTTMFVWCVIVVNGCVLVGLVACVLYLFALRSPCVCLTRSEWTEGDRLLEYPVEEEYQVR